MSQLIRNDEEFKKFMSVSVSPRLRKFVGGLCDGSAPLDWSRLDSLGFKQADGSYFRLMDSTRDYKTQCEIYKKGRFVTTTETKNSKGYKSTRLRDDIVLQSAICTYAWGGQSYHNFGLAVDLVVRSFGEVEKGVSVSKGGQTWATLEEFYKDIGLLKWADDCGIEWGGFWVRPYDCVHWQDSSYKLPSDVYDYMCNYEYISNSSSNGSNQTKDGQGVSSLLLVGIIAICSFVGGLWG